VDIANLMLHSLCV